MGGCRRAGLPATRTSGFNTLVGSFVPNDDIAGVTGVECVLDVLIGDGVSPIPPWWDMHGPGECRDFGLGGVATLTATGVASGSAVACVDWASGGAQGGLAAYSVFGLGIPPANQPAHRQVVMGFAVPSVNAADLVNTQEYFAFNLIIRNYKTVGTGACTGCVEPACIVFQSVNIVPGVNPGQRVTAGTFAGSNFAIWQNSAPDCHLVPAKRTTWSAVKQLYH